jgi:PAS domain S-box-containing protein
MNEIRIGGWWRRFTGRGGSAVHLESGGGSAGFVSREQISRIAGEWTATFDTIPDYIALIDGSYKILRVNRPMARLLSRDPREVIGRPCYELVHGRSEPWPDCPHQLALDGNCCVSREVFDAHLGVPLMVTCAPYHDALGELIATVHVARDISEQKRAEETQRQLIARLQGALSKVQLLSGMLPICCSCKKIRDDKGYWKQIEVYIRDHSEAEFSHGICPECVAKLYPQHAKPEPLQ